MALHNVRRSSNNATMESYDPKQRLVGGIVLFLIILLIYSILKLVLGISSASAGKFGLNTPIGEEISALEAAENNTVSGSNPNSPPITTTTARRSNRILLPQSFVFLDLSGNPLQKETYQSVTLNNNPATSNVNVNVNVSTPDQYANVGGDKSWFVQVASFREEDRAQKLVQQIKDKEIVTEVNIVKSSSGWFMVRLPPETDRDTVEQQRKQINSALRLKAEVRKLE